MYKFFSWFLAKFWKNFGGVTKHIYRSGQMGKIRLPITVYLCDIKCIIALNMDGSCPEEKFEKEYCEKNGIKTIHFNWSASDNKYPDQLDLVLQTLENNENKEINTLVHCAGGKDRTGGVIGHWIFLNEAYQTKNSLICDFIEQCRVHQIPDKGWVKSVMENYKG